MALVSCPGCEELVGATECRCPHCDRTLRVCRPGIARSASAALLGLALNGCNGSEDTDLIPQPEYGVPFVDDDQDGYEESVDCDDTDPDIHPDAEETVGDGVDSNCDGDDDT